MGVKVMHGFPQDGEQVSLTPDQKAQVAARSRRGVALILLSQAVAGLLAGAILWLAGGWQLALSAVCGSLTYLLPNAVFGARLMLSTFTTRGAGPVVFFIGQGLKVVVAVILLWSLSRLDANWLNWPSVVAGLVATLKGYWVMVLLTGGRITKYM